MQCIKDSNVLNYTVLYCVKLWREMENRVERVYVNMANTVEVF